MRAALAWPRPFVPDSRCHRPPRPLLSLCSTLGPGHGTGVGRASKVRVQLLLTKLLALHLLLSCRIPYLKKDGVVSNLDGLGGEGSAAGRTSQGGLSTASPPPSDAPGLPPPSTPGLVGPPSQPASHTRMHKRSCTAQHAEASSETLMHLEESGGHVCTPHRHPRIDGAMRENVNREGEREGGREGGGS